MSSYTESFIVQTWNWVKANDLPNWVAVVFTTIAWDALRMAAFGLPCLLRQPHLAR